MAKKHSNKQKNKQEQIALYKEMRKLQQSCKDASNTIAVQVYACFIKCLYDGGFSPEQLEDLVADTQALWAESLEHIGDLVEWCYKTTGIDIRMIGSEDVTGQDN